MLNKILGLLLLAAVLLVDIKNLPAAEGDVKPSATPPAAAAPATAAPATATPATAAPTAAAPAPALAAGATPPAQPAAVQPGHSLHGEAFDEGPRQKAYLMDGTGGVHFPITTTSPAGPAVLRSGRRPVARLLVLRGRAVVPPGRGARSRLRDGLLGHGDGQREQRQAGQELHREGRRRRRPAQPARSGLDRCPDGGPCRQRHDRAATQIRSRSGIAGAGRSERPRGQGLSGAANLEERQLDDREQEAAADLQPPGGRRAFWTRCLPLQPMHPAHHYRIHLWDDEKPARALVAASLCGQTSPGSRPHVAHAGTHLFEAAPLCRRRLAARGVGPRGSCPHDARRRAARSDSQLCPQQRVADSRPGLLGPRARRDRPGDQHDRACPGIRSTTRPTNSAAAPAMATPGWSTC